MKGVQEKNFKLKRQTCILNATKDVKVAVQSNKIQF